MFEATCPTLATPYIAGRSDLLSTHRTAAGTIGYARCVCGGLVVISDDGAGWSPVGHAAGPRTPVVATASATVSAERCA